LRNENERGREGGTKKTNQSLSFLSELPTKRSLRQSKEKLVQIFGMEKEKEKKERGGTRLTFIASSEILKSLSSKCWMAVSFCPSPPFGIYRALFTEAE